MCFLRNGSSYSFETCTIGIGMPENLRVHWLWPSKYKRKWCYSPKCVFSKTDHHTALKLVPLGSACLKTAGCNWLWPSKYKGKWCYSPKCVFSKMDHHTALKLVPLGSACLKTQGAMTWPSKYKGKWCYSPKCDFLRNGSSYSFETCTTAISMPENLRLHWLWPSKYKRKWCYSPKCVFSEMDHHTALKLVPLGLACLKTCRVCTDFDPPNTKESDVIAQNVFSQKWIIIQLWNLYHCNQHAWKPQGALTLTL